MHCPGKRRHRRRSRCHRRVLRESIAAAPLATTAGALLGEGSAARHHAFKGRCGHPAGNPRRSRHIPHGHRRIRTFRFFVGNAARRDTLGDRCWKPTTPARDCYRRPSQTRWRAPLFACARTTCSSTAKPTCCSRVVNARSACADHTASTPSLRNAACATPSPAIE